MIRKIFFMPLSFIIIIMTLNCSSLPVLEHSSSGKRDNLILKGKYRITQSIKAELPNGNNALLIGITLIDTSANTINAVLMTVEGIVLLDAEYKDNNISITRCVPPFDSQDFAKGLMDDIKLIYLVSECKVIESGILAGKQIDRYRCTDGSTIDVSAKDNTMYIRKYDSGNSLTREAELFSISEDGIPGKAEITASGLFGYSLLIELINFENIL